MNEKEHDEEIGRWQEAIYNLVKDSTGAGSEIDGAGCDSGDPLDFTLSEISQGYGIMESRIDKLRAALKRAKKIIRAFHGKPGWDTYDTHAPEMKQINEALKI